MSKSELKSKNGLRRFSKDEKPYLFHALNSTIHSLPERTPPKLTAYLVSIGYARLTFAWNKVERDRSAGVRDLRIEEALREIQARKLRSALPHLEIAAQADDDCTRRRYLLTKKGYDAFRKRWPKETVNAAPFETKVYEPKLSQAGLGEPPEIKGRSVTEGSGIN